MAEVAQAEAKQLRLGVLSCFCCFLPFDMLVRELRLTDNGRRIVQPILFQGLECFFHLSFCPADS